MDDRMKVELPFEPYYCSVFCCNCVRRMFSQRFQRVIRPLGIAVLASSCITTSRLEKSPPIVLETKSIGNDEEDPIAIISGTTSKLLSQKICDQLGKNLSPTDISKFSDGETSISLRDSMRGKDVFVIQTCAAPVNESTMELLLAIGAAKRAGASSVTAIIPYFGYRLNRRGFPISSTHHSRFLWNASFDIAKMLMVLGADKVLSVDLQRPGQNHEACFFKNSLPAETISTSDLFIQFFQETLPKNGSLIIMSPNTELVKKAKKYQSKLRSVRSDLVVDCGAFLRNDAETIPLNASSLEIKGDVKGKDVILISDYIGK
jgi:ribose-phosphate pyrophosphokinase